MTGPAARRHSPDAVASRVPAAGTPPAAPGLTPPGQDDRDQARLDLSAVITAPRDARHFTTATLKNWQIPHGAISSSKTIVTELITNSYQATRSSPAACISLTLRRLPGEVVIEVSDNGPELPAMSDVADDAENGRGLLMVEAMSKEWGCQPSATAARSSTPSCRYPRNQPLTAGYAKRPQQLTGPAPPASLNTGAARPASRQAGGAALAASELTL